MVRCFSGCATRMGRIVSATSRTRPSWPSAATRVCSSAQHHLEAISHNDPNPFTGASEKFLRDRLNVEPGLLCRKMPGSQLHHASLTAVYIDGSSWRPLRLQAYDASAKLVENEELALS